MRKLSFFVVALPVVIVCFSVFPERVVAGEEDSYCNHSQFVSQGALKFFPQEDPKGECRGYFTVKHKGHSFTVSYICYGSDAGALVYSATIEGQIVKIVPTD